MGHVGIYRGLVAQAGLTTEQELELFEVLQRKANCELAELLEKYAVADDLRAIFLSLPKLNGDQAILSDAVAVFAAADASVKAALAQLCELADILHGYYPELTISFDLAELRGYHYHTGMVFSAFVPQVGKEIARGGRYDNIGQIFGCARPATGFSADLKVLAALTKKEIDQDDAVKILVPYVKGDNDLDEKVRDLRASGHIVIKALSEQQDDAQQLGCNQTLEKIDKNWVLVPLN